MAGLRTYLSHPPNFGSLKITKHTLCRLRFYLLCFYTVNASQHILIEKAISMSNAIARYALLSAFAS